MLIYRLYPTGKLHFVVSNDICKPEFQNTQKSVYYCTDSTLIYTAFFADFGPVDLGLTYTFCEEIHEILRTAVAAKKSVVYYCANHPHKRANSAVLICAYLVSTLECSSGAGASNPTKKLLQSLTKLMFEFSWKEKKRVDAIAHRECPASDEHWLRSC